MKKLRKVISIDDEQLNNYIIQRLLERFDCIEEIVSFEEASDALGFLETEKSTTESQPDLLFLDLNMPGMNGWEFIEKYREAIRPERISQIVILSSSILDSDRERAEEIPEVGAYVSKPLDEQKIKELLKSLFEDLELAA